MKILGICCFYHDASASLLIDGKIVAAAQEERFTRKKHDVSFPINAVEFCLKSANLKIEDIDTIGFYEKPLLKFERGLYQHIDAFPKSYKTFVGSMPSWFTEKLRVVKIIKKKLKYKKDILFVDHHLAHAASFLSSPFKKAAIVTIDGVGEWTTTTYGIGNGNRIKLLKEIKFPHSLGLLYSTITAYLGFSVNNSEYKVMGLSPYGTMDKKKNEYYKKLKTVIDIKEDGSYRLDLSFFTYHYKDRMPSKKLCDLLGGSIRAKESALEQRHKDIAAALQMLLEECVFKIAKQAKKETRCDKLVISGGVALNSVCNGKLIKEARYKGVWAQPDPGDGGTSIGVASYIYHTLFNNKRKESLINPFLEPAYTNGEIKKILDDHTIIYTTFNSDKEIIETSASLIANNKVVGWFQGGMEWGPRALGGRSILSNPCNQKMKEILNEKVKHREIFRPFAPAVCLEDASKYFKCGKADYHLTDFMLGVYPIRKSWHKLIPAVTHVDGSGRLQTARKENNLLYYKTIKKFGELSGIPILINTSFNIRGEPIVCSPYDAYKCMMGTGIDVLIIGNMLIKREENKKDEWDSERIATD